MKTLNLNFKPANIFTKDFIEADILPKLNHNLPAVGQATKEELVIAVSAFFAHGRHAYVVDYSDNPLIEEILAKLVYFGYIHPNHRDDKVFKLGLPIDRLEFKTLNSSAGNLKIKTTYKTTYTDGSHSEVSPEDVAFIDGYTKEMWEGYYGSFASKAA